MSGCDNAHCVDGRIVIGFPEDMQFDCPQCHPEKYRYKTVLMPIRVPTGNYCWQGHHPCESFDNEGGHGRCTLGYDIKEKPKGSCMYMKDPLCANLRED